jgi:hypothetical protein
MANFIVTYDLNRPTPTHRQMDEYLREHCHAYGRVLETVWYVKFPGTAPQLRDLIAAILDPNDLLLVVQTTRVAWTSLLLNDVSFKRSFES